jgi:hypothetical protein
MCDKFIKKMIASFLNYLPMVVLFFMVVLFAILVYLLSNRQESTPLHTTMSNGIVSVTEESTEEEN